MYKGMGTMLTEMRENMSGIYRVLETSMRE